MSANLDDMPLTDESLICQFGHIATTNQLFCVGETTESIRSAVAHGQICRAVKGVYVCRHADRDLLAAARVHGRIDCVSALDRAGVWNGMRHPLHLRVSSHAARTGVANNRAVSGARNPADVRMHWDAAAFGSPPSVGLMSPMDALLRSLRCLDEEHAIAALESAVHERFITLEQFRRICMLAPGRLGHAIREIEFTSDSGLETIVRRRTRHAGFRVTAQGFIPGVGRQDLVVEDVVGLEVDGGVWHATPEQFEIDRDRDLRSIALGRGVIRLTHSAVFLHWETCMSAIARAVADARDLRRYRGR